MTGTLAPDPAARHVVHFYDSDAELVDCVGERLVAAVAEGAVSVMVATPEHHRAFAEHAAARGIDLAWARQDGLLVTLDAAGTLERLMPGGRLSSEAFSDVVGSLIRDAGRAGRPVRAFGEMVALLWEAGRAHTAIELEKLWNGLGHEQDFELYCAYPSRILAGREQADALRSVCGEHAAVVAPSAEPIELALDLPARPVSTARARRFVRKAVDGWGFAEPAAGDAELIASELTANAILHAGTPLRVELQRFGPMVRIAVQDGSGERPVVLEPDVKRFSGRGMYLVDQVAVAWGVEPDGEGKTVWADLLA